MPRDVVSTTNDDHPALASQLERELIAEKEKQFEGLISAKDWPDFQKRKGLIDGLNAAISLCQTAQKKLNA